MSFDVGLSTKTISRVLNRDTPVDLRSLELLFACLDIALQPSDFVRAYPGVDKQHVLPERRSAFFGRAIELVRLRDLLENRRAVTLIGAGGVGKTRLALEALARFADDSFDRIAYCDLSEVHEPSLVAPAVVAAFGGRHDWCSSLATILEIAQDGRTVLLVDNCEHVLEQVAVIVDHLLDSNAALVVLATSREALGIDGEAVVRIDPFSVPDGTTYVRAAEALRNDAIALFVDRACCADDGFRFHGDAAEIVIDIVARAEGMPLAIEIAATHVATTELAEIASSLCDPRRALLSESVSHGSRHHSAHATSDRSYQLLDEVERRIFRRLAVFSGSFDAAAARIVVADELIDVAAVIGRLVCKSLLYVQRGSVPTRYRMLGTVRQYAAFKLDEHREAAAIRLHDGICCELFNVRDTRGDAPDGIGLRRALPCEAGIL